MCMLRRLRNNMFPVPRAKPKWPTIEDWIVPRACDLIGHEPIRQKSEYITDHAHLHLKFLKRASIEAEVDAPVVSNLSTPTNTQQIAFKHDVIELNTLRIQDELHRTAVLAHRPLFSRMTASI